MKKLCISLLVTCLYSTASLGQPVIMVYGNVDSLKILNQTKLCLEYLDVYENICLCVRFSDNIPDNSKGITFPLNTETVNEEGQPLPVYQVRINAKLSNRLRGLVLAHEMVHVKQFVKGELSMVDEHSVIWKNEAYRYLVAADRLITPWEQEAYGQDDQLAKLVEKNIYLSPLISTLP